MFKTKLKQSYSFKMLCCIFLVLIIILSAFVMYLFTIERNQGLAIMEKYNDSIIASVNSDYSILESSARSAYTKTTSNNIVSLMYSEPSEQDSADYKKAVSQYLDLLPSYGSAVIYNNKLKAYHYFNITSLSAEDIKYNIENNAGEVSHYLPYITKLPSTATNEYVISFYNYDYVIDSTMDGAFVLNLSLDWINNIIKKQTIPVNIILCDNTGMVVYDASKALDYGTMLPSEYTAAIGDKASYFSYKDNSQKSFVSITPLERSNYYCCVEQPYSGIYSGYMNKLWLNFIFLILFILIISIIVSILLSNYLSQPIRSIKKMVSGNELEADSDLFAYLSSLLEAGSRDSTQLDEMQLLIDDIRQQNTLKQILLGKSIDDHDDFEELKAVFADTKITGILLTFADIVDVTQAKKTCGEFFKEFDGYKLVPITNLSIVILLHNNDNAVDSHILLENLRNVFEADMNMLPSIFVSERYTFDRLSTLYNEIKLLSGYELLYGRGCIINSYIISHNNNEQNPTYPKESEEELLNTIDERNTEACIEKFDNFLARIICFSLNDFKASLMRLAFALQAKYESGTNKQHKNEVSSLVKQVSSANTMNDVHNCFTRLFDINSLTDDAQSTESYQHSYVDETIRLIEASYKDPLLNLESLSEEIKLSTNYLGRLFKAETGLSVNNYITKIRLEKAIKLLDDSTISIKEIITETGFTNESNFYRQFKKQYGITPSAYRAQ